MKKFIVLIATVLVAGCIGLLCLAASLVWSLLTAYSTYGSLDIINYWEIAVLAVCLIVPACVLILWTWITTEITTVRSDLDKLMELERLQALGEKLGDKVRL